MKKGQCLGKGRTASVYEWGKNEVLKLFNEGFSMGSEFENCKIINSLGIPSPEVVETVEIDGQQGIIYERINGVTMSKIIEPNFHSLSKYARILAEIHSMIHSFKVDYTPNLKKELSERISFSKKLNVDTRNKIIKEFDKLPEGNTICHYDFHPDNIIMSQRGPVIIDWANVLVGDSLADVTRTSLILKSHAVPPGECPYWFKDRNSRLHFHKEYLNEYLKLENITIVDLKPWELPMAAVRLGEGIKEEEQQLTELINKSVL